MSSSTSEAKDAKNRDRWFTGIGIAGPSVIAGAMLLLNKIALDLFIGFGPIFIMCLLFDSTKQLFHKWLLYGIGTVFSLAVLSVMVTIAMKMLAAVTAAFAVKYLLAMPGVAGAGSTDGINSMALQQGGLGLLLTTMIISAPPMISRFSPAPSSLRRIFNVGHRQAGAAGKQVGSEHCNSLMGIRGGVAMNVISTSHGAT